MRFEPKSLVLKLDVYFDRIEPLANCVSLKGLIFLRFCVILKRFLKSFLKEIISQKIIKSKLFKKCTSHDRMIKSLHQEFGAEWLRATSSLRSSFSPSYPGFESEFETNIRVSAVLNYSTALGLIQQEHKKSGLRCY